MNSPAVKAPEVPTEEPLKPVAEYLPFVKKVAHRLARRLPSHVGLDDLIGAGVVGWSVGCWVGSSDGMSVGCWVGSTLQRVEKGIPVRCKFRK